MKGRVVSVKMKNSASVLVEGKKTHALYKKSFAWSKKYLVGDPIGVKLGDIVEIMKCAPISKNKHFVITKVVGADLIALGEEHMKEKAQEAIEEVMPEEVEEESNESKVTEESKVEEEIKVEKPAKAEKKEKEVKPKKEKATKAKKEEKK